MRWLDSLALELLALGVPARERARIMLELGDHIDCEPGGAERLGDPRELAVSFAEELASDRARECALQAFWALAAGAVALTVSQLALDRVGGYPGFTHGLSLLLFFPALLGMLVAPQVALVAGTLAALRAFRRRGSARLPAAEVGLIARRTGVALWAGSATLAGLGLYLIDFSLRLPAWYLALLGTLVAICALAVSTALRSLAGARRIVSAAPGTAGDVFDDLPVLGRRWLRHRRWRLGAIGSMLVAVVMTIAQARAERSLGEGLQRGVVEGLAAAVGFAVLGRAVGLLPGRTDGLQPDQ
jgi:hypothetical protein